MLLGNRLEVRRGNTITLAVAMPFAMKSGKIASRLLANFTCDSRSLAIAVTMPWCTHCHSACRFALFHDDYVQGVAAVVVGIVFFVASDDDDDGPAYSTAASDAMLSVSSDPKSSCERV